MFSSLPNEILKMICDNLNIKDERKLAFLSPVVNALSREEMSSRLALVLNNPEPEVFYQFLKCITDDEKTGYAILQDETCKHILINQKPAELPHWILSVAECQPNLLEFIMNDEYYRNSLTNNEKLFLLNNYNELFNPELIDEDKETLLQNIELSSKDDDISDSEATNNNNP